MTKKKYWDPFTDRKATIQDLTRINSKMKSSHSKVWEKWSITWLALFIFLEQI
jgi:hypothetical protein